MKRFLLLSTCTGLALYAAVCAALYYKQESLIFHPQKLPALYKFTFPGRYVEWPVVAPDGTRLSGLLFKADSAKGLVFFLHGNAGSLADWGQLAATYTQLGYDVFMLDYRGYGKSEGTITSQAQLLSDVDAAYEHLLARYAEGTVVVAGYSLGTGPAAWLAARHQPRLLLLHAAYYNIADMAAHTVRAWPLLPGFILRYPLATDALIGQVKCPVVLVHGDHDTLIPYNSSVRLRALGKPADQLITISGGGHNGLTTTPQYAQFLRNLL